MSISRSTLRARVDGEDARRVLLAIEDDGPGIPAADRDRVLAPGPRLDEQVGGHGFGLAIAVDLTRLYGGTITFSDSPLGGLDAAIRLPVAMDG